MVAQFPPAKMICAPAGTERTIRIAASQRIDGA
jgi:hypothetical protein